MASLVSVDIFLLKRQIIQNLNSINISLKMKPNNKCCWQREKIIILKKCFWSETNSVDLIKEQTKCVKKFFIQDEKRIFVHHES